MGLEIKGRREERKERKNSITSLLVLSRPLLTFSLRLFFYSLSVSLPLYHQTCGGLPEAAGGPHQGAAGFDALRREEEDGLALSAKCITYIQGQAAVSLFAQPGAGGSGCMKEAYILKWKKIPPGSRHQGQLQFLAVVMLLSFHCKFLSNSHFLMVRFTSSCKRRTCCLSLGSNANN